MSELNNQLSVDTDMNLNTPETFKHHPEVLALKAMFRDKEFAIFDIAENFIIVPSRLALPDHGMEKPEYLATRLLYCPETDSWAISNVVKIRKISESDPNYSLKAVTAMLNVIRDLMVSEMPTLDEEGEFPIEWTVDFDAIAVSNSNHRIGEVIGSINVIIEIADLFELIESFGEFPEVELQNYSELSDEERTKIMNDPDAKMVVESLK